MYVASYVCKKKESTSREYKNEKLKQKIIRIQVQLTRTYTYFTQSHISHEETIDGRNDERKEDPKEM